MRFLLGILLLVMIYQINGLAVDSRAYQSNPFNLKSIDLFFLVEESPSSVPNPVKHAQIKSAVSAIADKMNPSGSSPYYGVIFYGSTTAVRRAVTFPRTTASSLQTTMEQFQFSSSQSKTSSLEDALLDVESSCRLSCRSTAPRVIVILGFTFNSSAAATIRRLENELTMTVVVIGLENRTPQTVLDMLATPPAHTLAMSFNSISELISLAESMSNILSDIPRSVPANTYFETLNVGSGQEYTLQVNVEKFAQTTNVLIVYTTGCFDCRTYGSLKELRPTSVNTVQLFQTHAAYNVSNTHVFYFRVPKGARRFYLTFRPNFSSAKIGGQLYVFSEPVQLADFPKLS